jgi:hypothetical protein
MYVIADARVKNVGHVTRLGSSYIGQVLINTEQAEPINPATFFLECEWFNHSIDTEPALATMRPMRPHRAANFRGPPFPFSIFFAIVNSQLSHNIYTDE